MTALTLANIPSNINTYERLAFWVAQCLQSSAGSQEVLVTQNSEPQPVAYAQLGRTADGQDRAICVLYIPIDRAELNSDTEKTWMAATDISSATPHTNLLSN